MLAALQVGGFKAPFITVGGVVVVAALISIYVLPNITENSNLSGSFLPLLKSVGCIIIYFVVISNTMALSSMDPTFSPFLESKVGNFLH